MKLKTAAEKYKIRFVSTIQKVKQKIVNGMVKVIKTFLLKSIKEIFSIRFFIFLYAANSKVFSCLCILVLLQQDLTGQHLLLQFAVIK